MVNISALTKLVGSQARVTVGKKQFLTALDDAQPKVKEAISELLSKMKDPKIDIAYKASERGYTVAATTFRDGKKVIGNGALSLTDAGTEHAVVKMRLNIGKNGEVYRYSGYNNMAYSPKIEDIDITTSFKDGIYKQTNKNGNYGFQHQEVNIPKAVETLGFEEEGSLLLKKVNQLIEKIHKPFKDLFAGKEVDPASIKDNYLKAFNESGIKEFLESLS